MNFPDEKLMTLENEDTVLFGIDFSEINSKGKLTTRLTFLGSSREECQLVCEKFLKIRSK